MRRPTRATLGSFVTLVLLGGPCWVLLPTDPFTVAPYVPLVLSLAAVAGFLVAYGDRLTDRPRVTGPGPRRG